MVAAGAAGMGAVAPVPPGGASGVWVGDVASEERKEGGKGGPEAMVRPSRKYEVLEWQHHRNRS